MRLYNRGLIKHIPEGRTDTPEEAAERRRLAELFGQVEPDGKLASEMVLKIVDHVNESILFRYVSPG